MRRISIGSWAYNVGADGDGPVPFEAVLARLAELGFDGIELGACGGHPDPRDHPTVDDRERLRAEVAGHGLAFSGFAPDLKGEHLLDTRDPGAYVRAFETNARFALDLGIPGIRVDTVQPPTIHREIEYADLLRRLVTTWDRCIGHAGDHGLRVCWEFDHGFAFNKPSDIQRVLDRLPHANFGVLYDTGHGHMVAVVGAGQEGKRETLPGGQLELIARLSGRINHIHLIDIDDRGCSGEQREGEIGARLPLGEGRLDLAALVAALAREDAGHDWWTIDLGAQPDVWEASARCKAVVDELNRKYG